MFQYSVKNEFLVQGYRQLLCCDLEFLPCTVSSNGQSPSCEETVVMGEADTMLEFVAG